VMPSLVHVVVARWSGRLAAALREAARMTEKEFAEYLGISPRVAAFAAGDRTPSGAALALLGHADEAMGPLGRAAVLASPRRQVNVLVNTALARVAQREPEQACADLTQAYEQRP
jgi:hypothetical protein